MLDFCCGTAQISVAVLDIRAFVTLKLNHRKYAGRIGTSKLSGHGLRHLVELTSVVR